MNLTFASSLFPFRHVSRSFPDKESRESKNVLNSSRTDFDGKDTTTGTVKARKKVDKFFLSSFTLVSQQVMTYRKKVGKILSLFISICFSVSYDITCESSFLTHLDLFNMLSTKNSRKLLTCQLGSVVRHKSDNQNQRITVADATRVLV